MFAHGTKERLTYGCSRLHPSKASREAPTLYRQVTNEILLPAKRAKFLKDHLSQTLVILITARAVTMSDVSFVSPYKGSTNEGGFGSQLFGAVGPKDDWGTRNDPRTRIVTSHFEKFVEIGGTMARDPRRYKWEVGSVTD